MKSVHYLSLTLLLIAFGATAQKRMMIEADLKAASQEMPIKFKGISTLPKYAFGPYKVVSGKVGWATTNTKQKMFSNTSKSTSKQKISFVLQGPQDSAVVNASIKGYYEEQHWFFGNFSTIEEDLETYTAYISTSQDTLDWELAMLRSINTGFKAGIQNRVDQFEIIPTDQFENGKRAMGGLGFILGYTIYHQGVAVASVQTMMNQAAWIRNDLPEDLKLRLAASITSILVFQTSAGN